MLDLPTVIEWSHALQEQQRRLRAESGRLEADYKLLAFRFEQFKKVLPQSKPGNGITNSRTTVNLQEISINRQEARVQPHPEAIRARWSERKPLGMSEASGS